MHAAEESFKEGNTLDATAKAAVAAWRSSQVRPLTFCIPTLYTSSAVLCHSTESSMVIVLGAATMIDIQQLFCTRVLKNTHAVLMIGVISLAHCSILMKFFLFIILHGVTE